MLVEMDVKDNSALELKRYQLRVLLKFQKSKKKSYKYLVVFGRPLHFLKVVKYYFGDNSEVLMLNRSIVL